MKIVVFGNSFGLQSTLNHLGTHRLAGVVTASNRIEDASSVHLMVRQNDTPCFTQPAASDKEKSAKLLQDVRALSPDLVVANCYSMRLDADLRQVASRGAINVHWALLPEYRGANTLNWMLINGEKVGGVTIHQIAEEYDSGPILAQARVEIDETDTAVTLRSKLMPVAGSLLLETLDSIESGEIRPTPQDERRAHSWPRRRPEDGHIDWSWPAERIHNFIRGLVAPWPGAFYYEDGRKIVIDHYMTLEEVRALRKRIRPAE